jgi:type IV pilus assembly protein PilW
MISAHTARLRRTACGARGFTLVELMVALSIGVFLIFGLVTVVQNIRTAYNNQQALALLQDEQRFATTVITDVVQSGGYFPNTVPPTFTPNGSLPLSAPYLAGQAFYGTHPSTTAPYLDTLGVRYRTAINDGVILCNGSSNTTQGPNWPYTNTFSVNPPAAPLPGQLMCQVNGNAPIAIADGVVQLQVWFGVKRNFSFNDYNVDTYLTPDQMAAADWDTVSTVRVIITFTNPLYPQAGQPQTIPFERVIQVMGRGGVHT